MSVNNEGGEILLQAETEYSLERINSPNDQEQSFVDQQLLLKT